MQIKNLTDMFRPVENSENRALKDKAGRVSRDESSPKGDRVNLSQAAQLYKAAHQAAQNSSGVRIDMVGQIKGQVADGTYKMNARKTAEKMLEQELALWGGNK